jgi:hypothetical protein
VGDRLPTATHPPGGSVPGDPGLAFIPDPGDLGARLALSSLKASRSNQVP